MAKKLAVRRLEAAARAAISGKVFTRKRRWMTSTFTFQYFKGPNSTESHVPLTQAQRDSAAKDEMQLLNAKLVRFMSSLNPQCTPENRCHTTSSRQACKSHFSQWWAKHGPHWDKHILFDGDEANYLDICKDKKDEVANACEVPNACEMADECSPKRMRLSLDDWCEQQEERDQKERDEKERDKKPADSSYKPGIAAPYASQPSIATAWWK